MKKILNKKIIIPVIIVVFIVIVGVIYLFLFKNNLFKIGETLNITNPTDYLVQYDDGDYYLMKANADIKFEVSSSDKKLKYKIVDENDNEIKTKIVKKNGNYVIAANKNYEAGKTYKLTLENAIFTDEKLSDIKTLYFTIVRPNSNTQILNDNVIKVNKDIILDVKKDDNYYTITSNKEFKKDDILYYQNGDQIIAFKVGDIYDENGSYVIKTDAPTLEEIFKELDIYGEFDLSLSDFITNDELKDYIKVAVAREGLLNNIVPGVKASNIFDVEVESQKDGSAKVTLSLELSSGENTIFKKGLKNHDIKLNIEFIVKLKTNSHITLFNQDIGARIDIELGTSFNIEPTDDEFLSFKKETDNNEEFNLALSKEKLENLELDTSKDEKPIVETVIPTPVAGLTVNLEIDFVHEFEIALETALGMRSNVSISFGYNNKKGFYKNFDFDIKESDYSILGKGEAKLGFAPKVSVGFIGVLEAGIEAPIGMYTEVEVNYMKSSSKDEIDGSFKFGAFVSAGVYAEFKALGIKLDKVEATYEKKLPIIEIERKIVDNCEKKLLNGDFSCYVGTYTNEEYSDSNIKIDKNGIVGVKSYDIDGSTKDAKLINITKNNKGAYVLEYDVGNGTSANGYYTIVPVGVDYKYERFPCDNEGNTCYYDTDSNKMRIIYYTMSWGEVYYKDDGNCEEKLLKGDFSCYVGSYTNKYDPSDKLVIDKNGIASSNYNYIKEPISIIKESGEYWSYYCKTGYLTTTYGYEREVGFRLFPKGVDSGWGDINKTRISVLLNTGGAAIFEKD